jgi:hypothetical protein
VTQYRIKLADETYARTLELTEPEWFALFLSGRYADIPVEWIERTDDPAKRVEFEEHLNGPQSS